MKKLILVVILNFTLFGISQERVDGIKLNFNSKSNTINRPDYYNYNEVEDKWEKLKMQYDEVDFIEISFLKIEYKNKNYYILKSKTKSIEYKYPNLKMDPYILTFNKGFVFEESEFNNLINYKTAYCSSISINTFSLSEKDFLNKTIEYLKSESYYMDGLKFIEIKVENSSKIRFRMPEVNTGYRIPFENRYYEIDKSEFDKLFVLK